MIRQPIITVLGHVDHGKTSILDAIRSSRVAKKEAGAITQHIGATEIPIESINQIAGDLIKKFGFNLKIPGLLVIDTPGHEAFTNLRKRGGSIADLAILVVDATQGIQPQTKEAIDILRANKVPFIIAMNKIDLLHFYDSKKGSFLANLNSQNENVKRQMDETIYTLVGKIYEHGFSSERFDRCEFGKQIPIVPCSAHTLEGLPEILTLLSGLSQKYLESNLEIQEGEVGKGAILEAKEEQGLGKTIDVILYKGTLNVNDEIAFLSKNGIVKTKIRALLQPKPLVEMKDTKEKFRSVKEVRAAIGVKIAAPNLNDALVGSTITQVKSKEDLVELESEIKESTYTTDAIGLIVKADAIGSLEAVVALLKKEGYTIKKAEIGNINRKDIMEASGILEKDPYLGCAIGFNVDVENEAQKEAQSREVKIFTDKVIYKIIEDYDKWVKDKKEEAKKAGLSALVYPCEFEVMRGKVFRNNKPAIFGASVNCGKLREGIRVINKEGEIIGRVSGIQNDGKSVKELNRGEEAAVAIDEASFLKNLKEGEMLYSYLPPKQYGELVKFFEEFNEEEKELIKKIKEKIKVEENA